MIRRNHRQASSLFLLELILAILFFSITSAVCLRLFVQAHVFSRDAQRVHLAVSECSSVAELFRASDSIEEACGLIGQAYPGEAVASLESGLVLYFDEESAPCAPSEAASALLVRFSREGRMLYAHIRMMEAEAFGGSWEASLDTEPLYQVTVQHYLPGRVAYAR